MPKKKPDLKEVDEKDFEFEKKPDDVDQVEQEFELTWATSKGTFMVLVGAVIRSDGFVDIHWVRDRLRLSVRHDVFSFSQEDKKALTHAVLRSAGICTTCIGAKRTNGPNSQEVVCPRCKGTGEYP